MREPPRLLDSSANPAVRALLEAGLPDAPPRAAARRTLLALGVGAGALAAVASPASAAAGIGAAMAAPAAKSGLLTIAAQWLAIGAVSGLGLAAGATWVGSTTPDERLMHPSAGPSARARPSAPKAISVRTPDATVERSPESLEPDTVASPARATRAANRDIAPSAATALPLVQAGDLGREVRLIDRAREALAAGDVRRALGTLDEYSAVNHTRTLDREAQVLRIDALIARGDRAAAATLAQAYLSEYPADPHAEKLRLIATGSAASGR